MARAAAARHPRAHMREVLGEKTFAERKPLIEAALRGEREFFASDLRPSGSAGSSRCRPTICRGSTRRPDEVDGIVIVITDVTEQRVAERVATRERGAVPADRQFGAGDDVGDAARPRPRLRQRRLCRVRLRARVRPGDGADARLARSDPSRRRRPDRRRKHRRRGVARSAFTLEGRYRRYDGEYRWLRTRLAAALRPGRGARRLHRRRHRHHACQGSGARASPPGRRADGAARCVARPSSARCSKRRWR